MPTRTDDIARRVNALTPDQLATLAGRLGVPVAGRRRLVAFCEPADRTTQPADTKNLRSYLENRLPGPQVPAEIHFIAQLPQLPNGKTDFGALAAMRPQTPADAPTAATSPSLSPTESTLLEIWAEILGTDAITTDDNFFELGGDSISSIHVLAMASKAGFDIPSQAIFDNPTIRQLATLATPKSEPATPTRSTGRTTAASAAGTTFPTNSLQKALFLKNQNTPLQDPGVIQVQCKLSGKLDRHAFQQTWQSLFQRHGALRSSIGRTTGSDPRLRVAESDIAAPTVDFSNIGDLPHDEQQAHIDQLLATDRSDPLDITSAPVARLAVVSLSQDSHVLLWTCHHALIDGWSASVILEEFIPLYHSCIAGALPSLPPPSRLGDYHGWLSSQDEFDEEWFWREQLHNLDPRSGELPVAGPPTRPPAPTFETGSVSLPPSVVAEIEAAARSLQSTPYLFFLAAWGLCLSSYGDRRDIVFGATLSGRSSECAGSDRLVGSLANSLPFRIRVEADETLAAFLTRLRKTHRALLGFQQVDLAKIHHRWSGVPMRVPLFESLVVFANFLGREAAAVQTGAPHQLTIDSYHSGISSTFPATLAIVPGDPWKINLVYDTSRVPRETSAELLAKMRSVLEVIGRSTERPVLSLRPPSSPLPSRTPTPDPAPAPPLHDLQPGVSRMVEIWRNAFGDDTVGPDDDFVALGGHSLLGVVLVTEVELEFRCALATNSIQTAPTPRKLAAAVRLARQSDAGPHAPPEAYIFIPGGFGDALYFIELRRDDSGDLRVHGEIRARKLLVHYTEQTPVAEVATRYAAELRKIQPAGPIHLASRYCAEFISLEVARHLAATGEHLAFLGIIDHAPPSPPAVSPQTAKRFARKLQQMIRERQFARLADYALRAPSTIINGISERIRSTGSRSPATAPTTEKPGRFFYTESHFEFSARRFPGRATLFLSSEFEASDNGKVTVERWQEQAEGGVEIVRIEGPKNPDIFAPPLSDYLDRALNQRTPTSRP